MNYEKMDFYYFSFILSFIILVTLMFELAFRLLKADEVINFMEKSVFIDSFNSLVYLFGYIIIHRCYHYQQRGIFKD